MAFPQVQSITETTTSGATSHNIQMPATVNAGDLLLVLVTNNQGNINSYPDGWAVLFDHPTTPVFLKEAAGTEDGGTIAIGTSSSSNMAAQVWRVTGWRNSGTILNDVEIASTFGTSTTPNPPALNPANWDTEDTLWAVYAGWFNSATFSSYPTNYSNGVTTGPLGARMATARRELTAVSEDPGTYALSGSATWRSHTIAIRPAGAFLFEGSAEVSFDGTVNVDAVSDIVFTGSGALDFDGTAQVTQIAVMDGAEEVSFDGTVVLSGGALLLVGDGDVSFDGSVSLNQDAVFEGFGDVTMNGLVNMGVIREFAASQSVSFDGSANLTAIGWQEVDIASSQIWTVKK